MISHFHDGAPYMQHTALTQHTPSVQCHAARAARTVRAACVVRTARVVLGCGPDAMAQCFLTMGTTFHLRRQHKERGRKRE